jgi:hypothetical protein
MTALVLSTAVGLREWLDQWAPLSQWSVALGTSLLVRIVFSTQG